MATECIEIDQARRAVGAYFGQDVRGIAGRLLAEQLPDGGWNCEAAHGSRRSSFNTTICVLEALFEYEQTAGGSLEVTEARLRGQEYLLERRLFHRRSTGEVIERDRKDGTLWTHFAFPTWWHYDVLRGLDYLGRAGVRPDERVAEAIGWSYRSVMITGGGHSIPCIPVRCRSRWTRVKASPAGGTPYVLYEY